MSIWVGWAFGIADWSVSNDGSVVDKEGRRA
jgi:hypothetical protein